MILAASERRSAKRVDPICTAIGFEPNGPKAMILTISPGTKPKSRKRSAIGSGEENYST